MSCYKTSFVFVMVIITLFQQGCQKFQVLKTDFRGVEPPNGVKINASLYCDATELSNFGWREYMYWVGNHYGFESDAYLSALPDTTVWNNEIYGLHHLRGNYLRNPVNDDFPVVGISQKQAEAYSIWRSNAVFYFLLIELKEVKHSYDKEFNKSFTIENYFNNRIKGVVPNPEIKYYPRFRLPTPEERVIVLQYADSVNTNGLKNCKSAFCKK